VLSRTARLAIAGGVLIVAVFVASRFGLVALIARGYPWLAIIILTIYVLPLLTWGLWRILRHDRPGERNTCDPSGDANL